MDTDYKVAKLFLDETCHSILYVIVGLSYIGNHLKMRLLRSYIVSWIV